MPVPFIEWSKSGVERQIGAPNGKQGLRGRGLLLGRLGYNFALKARSCRESDPQSVIQGRPQHGDGEMCEIGCILVELQVADDAMLGQIFCDPGFGDAQMLREFRFQ